MFSAGSSIRIKLATTFTPLFGALAAVLFLSGCASIDREDVIGPRPFTFEHDTLAFTNQLLWAYGYDASGKWVMQKRDPKPTYSLRCFVLARTVKQFFQNAFFDANARAIAGSDYRELIKRVVSKSPRGSSSACQKVVIPGYPNLKTFSQAQQQLFQQECGSAVESYFQRGNWRMIFPFSRGHQAKTAAVLQTEIAQDWPMVVHVSRFPALTINHALLVYGSRHFADGIEFLAYDPNQPNQPTSLVYSHRNRTFSLSANDYFAGGRVDVYPVYTSLIY